MTAHFFAGFLTGVVCFALFVGGSVVSALWRAAQRERDPLTPRLRVTVIRAPELIREPVTGPDVRD